MLVGQLVLFILSVVQQNVEKCQTRMTLRVRARRTNQHVLPFIIFVLAPRPAATPIFHLIVGICFVRNSTDFFAF